MIRAGMIGIAATILTIQLKGYKSEYGIYINLAAGILLFSLIACRLESVIGSFREMISFVKIDSSYFRILLKMIGITYISEFTSGICKDAGNQSLSGQIEMIGKLTILGMGMPVLTALLRLIKDFLS